MQPGIFLLQIGQSDHLRRVVGAVHVVNMEFLEIAYDDPARVLIVGQIARIPPGLLIGRQHRAVGLLVALTQIDLPAFLFDQHPRLRDIAVDKAGMAKLNLLLKGHILGRVLHPEKVGQQRKPELLAFSFFIAFILPIFCKALGRRPPLHIVHIRTA